MGNTSSILTGERAKLNKEGKAILDRYVASCADLTDGEKSMRLRAKIEELLVTHKIPPVRLVKFSEFVKLEAFPRFGDGSTEAFQLDAIKRDESLIVFVSHVWLRPTKDSEGWSGRPHPDNTSNDMFKLCVNGLRWVKTYMAPRVSDYYLWIDYACVDQSGSPAEKLESLDKIVECCDAMFTPILDLDPTWSLPEKPDLFTDYQSARWREGPRAYLNRAWCRLEMLYASHIPLLGNSNSEVKRHTMFDADLAKHCRTGRRPHLLYGHREFTNGFAPLVLPSIKKLLRENYNPAFGHVSNASDEGVVEYLSSELTPYIESLREQYEGPRNDNDERHGRGTLRNERGDEYCGDWSCGYRHGEGRYSFANGDEYSGEWEAGRMSGSGTWREKNGLTFVGEMKDGRPEGHGVMTLADGSSYDGGWSGGKWDGQGTTRLASGQVLFKGERKDGLKSGFGSHSSTDGYRYQGYYREGKKEGRGTMVYPNGDTYEGEWRADVREGRGVLRWAASGGCYDGEWRGDRKEGRGVHTFAEGTVYEGEWRADRREGQGVARYAGGTVYEGRWLEGLQEGEGTMTFRNGNVYSGQWSRGCAEGRGRLTYANGDVYDGEWQADSKHGCGTLTFANGTSRVGQWAYGAYEGTSSRGSSKKTKLILDPSFTTAQDNSTNDVRQAALTPSAKETSSPLKRLSKMFFGSPSEKS